MAIKKEKKWESSNSHTQKKNKKFVKLQYIYTVQWLFITPDITECKIILLMAASQMLIDSQ